MMSLTQTTARAFVPPLGMSLADAATTILSFLDTASTSMGRATANNDRAAQQAAELAAHERLFALDRGVYALLLQLPGVTDRARQIGVKNLLGVRGAGDGLLDARLEAMALRRLVDELPAQRLFKLFLTLRVGDGETLHRANNARTRKLILRVVLGAPRLELWAVKYRRKLEASLTHAWGRKTTSVVRSILGKSEWTAKERSIVHDTIDRFARDIELARECVAFVLGVSRVYTAPLLVAYEVAKTDLSAGAKLPPEVLEGIRSTFHSATPKEKVLEITAGSMTQGQKLAVQRRATEAGVEIAFDATAHDAVRLYLYAFEMGMTADVAAALVEKAKEGARKLRLPYGRTAVLLDASASMAGSKEQPLRPMATALALRDVLVHATRATVFTVGGEFDGPLVRPKGATSLAGALLDAIETEPEAVFVISDGYENRPAGRFAEVVTALREMGIGTPIYHLNPVFAAEAKGVRTFGEGITAMPAQSPTALGVAFVRSMLAADPQRGIDALLASARPLLSA